MVQKIGRVSRPEGGQQRYWFIRSIDWSRESVAQVVPKISSGAGPEYQCGVNGLESRCIIACVSGPEDHCSASGSEDQCSVGGRGDLCFVAVAFVP